jgi:hypothetical protein
MSLQKKVQHFIHELKSDGFEIYETSLVKSENPYYKLRKFTDYVQFQKLTGSGIRVIKRKGYLVFDEDGQVGFDVFRGDLHKNHFKYFDSPGDRNGMFGMTSDPDLKGILRFLKV